MVGIKTNRDFLCLTFEIEQGETVSLVGGGPRGPKRHSRRHILVISDGRWICRGLETSNGHV